MASKGRSGELTMALVTRSNLKLSKGKLAAQCSHAAVECALKAKAKRGAARHLAQWRARGARKIVLKTETEQDLRELYAQAESAGLVTYLVRDAGHTEIPAGTITVVGIGPGPRHSIDALTGDFTLVS
jgi:PTH2 family peptidyl-tRNA hydrolase